MGSTKNVLAPYAVVSAGDMSGNLTSKVTVINYLDNLCYQLVWTGTPTGTFQVEVSLDGINWTALTLSPVPAASGSAGSYYVDLNQLSASFVRIKYVFGSGTGTLTATVSGKSV